MQEKRVKVKVGVENNILPCPPCIGSCGTPSGDALSQSTGFGRSGIPEQRSNVRLAPLHPSTTHRLKRKTKENARRGENTFEEFVLPDYIIAESPTLMRVYQEYHGNLEIGPINRSNRLFEAVVVLCKLRWIVRLHGAFMLFAGPECSLHRVLMGMLRDVCTADNKHTSMPVQVFELLVQTLELRFQESWPLFIRYVATVDISAYKIQHECSAKLRFPRSSRNDVVVNLGQSTAHIGADKSAPAPMWQIVDDIFICWVMQADSLDVAMEEVLQELDYFALERPVVRTNLDNLYEWHLPTASPISKQRHLLQVQQQGHHLAAFLELPSMGSESQYAREVLLNMARAIVAHPMTFNAELRTRVTSTLQGECRWVGFQRLLLGIEPDERQLSDVSAMSVSRRDAGTLNPQFLQTLKFSVPRTATAWVDKREMLLPAWQQSIPRMNLMKSILRRDSKTGPRSSRFAKILPISA
jgi:hypothetical protein